MLGSLVGKKLQSEKNNLDNHKLVMASELEKKGVMETEMVSSVWGWYENKHFKAQMGHKTIVSGIRTRSCQMVKERFSFELG